MLGHSNCDDEIDGDWILHRKEVDGIVLPF